VVDDQIRHQPIITGNRLDIGPLAKIFIDLKIVDDAEAVITAIGKERQNMHSADGLADMGLQKAVQRPQGSFPLRADRSSISDEDYIGLVPQMLFSDFSTLDHLALVRPEQVNHALGESVAVMLGIYHAQMQGEPLQQMVDSSAIIHDLACRFKKPLDRDRSNEALLCGA